MSKKQIVAELHNSIRRNFPRRRFEMRGINDTFQIDLVDVIRFARKNRGYKYFLVVIDTFSKYAWIRKLKTKGGPEVARAMEEIFYDNPDRIPMNVQSDHGKEFYNAHFQKLMTKYHINHYSTFSTLKASIVERFNRTFLRKLWQQFSLQGSHIWFTCIDKIIHNYNKSIHRTIKMRPIDVNKENQFNLLRTVYQANSTLYACSNKKSKLKFKLTTFALVNLKQYSKKVIHPTGRRRFFRLQKFYQHIQLHTNWLI